MRWKYVCVTALLVVIAGCGFCESDAVPTVSPLVVVNGVIFPVALPPPPPCVLVDVVFLIDDSDSMGPAGSAAGLMIRDLVGEGDREGRLQGQLAALYADQSCTPVFDVAYGVARYEDFGGSFREGDPSRPFILNMPVLRRKHPQFSCRFENALTRRAPGSGDPSPGVPDAQSGIEALYQIATGAGFDGDGDGSSYGNGDPGSMAAQTGLGESGDVPPVAGLFELLTDLDQGGTDVPGPPACQPEPLPENCIELPNGHAQYSVLGQGRESVPIEGEACEGLPVVVSSGCLGGVGFRPGAVKFVVMVTNAAVVAPTRVAGTTVESTSSNVTPSVQGPFQFDEAVPNAPREPATAELGEFQFTQFRCDPVSGDPDACAMALHPPMNDRAGAPGDPQVAPASAHTIEETVRALNALHIELLLLGTGTFLGIGPDLDPPTEQIPDGPTPWPWFRAMSRLTTPALTQPIRGRGCFQHSPSISSGAYALGALSRGRSAFFLCDGELKEVPPGIDASFAEGLAQRIRAWQEEGFLMTRPNLAPLRFTDLRLQVERDGSETNVRAVGATAAGIDLGEGELEVYWCDEGSATSGLAVRQEALAAFRFGLVDADGPRVATFAVRLVGSLVLPERPCVFGAVQRRMLLEGLEDGTFLPLNNLAQGGRGVPFVLDEGKVEVKIRDIGDGGTDSAFTPGAFLRPGRSGQVVSETSR